MSGSRDAYLVKLNFGLEDLSYLKLEGSVFVDGSSEECEVRRKRPSIECYVVDEQSGEDLAVRNDIKRIPHLHFHKLVDGIKIGSACEKSSCLKKLFSIRDDESTNGGFVLTKEETHLRRFSRVNLFINEENLSLKGKADFTLKHGDIIEGYNSVCGVCFKIMFLQCDEHHVRQPAQNSPLLSCPWPVLKKIFSCFTPFEIMENIVPVCRKFFELIRAGDIWNNLDFRVIHGTSFVPFGRLDDFCKVFSNGRVRQLTLDFRVQDGLEGFVPRDSLSSVFKNFDWQNLKVLQIIALEANDDAFYKFLVENGKVLSQLETLLIRDDLTGNSFLRVAATGKLVLPACQKVALRCLFKILPTIDMRLVFPRLEELHLIHTEFPASTIYGRLLNMSLATPTIQEFLAPLGSEVLSILHGYHLPAKMDKNGWVLAQQKGTFMNLESLGMHGDFFEHVPAADKNRPIFPKLRSLWLKDVSLIKIFHHLLLQTSLENLWIRNYRSQATESNRRICQDFLDSPKEWVKNLKYVSADLWETYIPYENLHHLECVALFFRCKAAVKFAKRVFEKLRSCSKLQGLILRVRDDLQLRSLNPLQQNLEFAVFTGTNRRSAMAALDFIRRSQNSLKDLWIQMDHTEDLEKLVPALNAFKRLRNVVFVLKNSFGRGRIGVLDQGWLEVALNKRVDPEGALKQATLFLPSSSVDSGSDYSSYTYNPAIMEKADFSLEFVTRFYFQWLKFIPDKKELEQADLFHINGDPDAYYVATSSVEWQRKVRSFRADASRDFTRNG
ncbi:unnamed protein product [Notodromas monacha]|uniref:F-box domain-containing protein n=1 Tax=Notodromas monacha TaxID=399045 RepID=A0A7R9BP66_9CRUS|nr:unnamed protein product [Notodromas monacha]CAG0918828.1 unnamed protein product [Notodromas monacha]